MAEGDSENAIEEANNKWGEPLRLAFIYQEYCTNSRWCQFLLTKANKVADGLAKQGIRQSRWKGKKRIKKMTQIGQKFSTRTEKERRNDLLHHDNNFTNLKVSHKSKALSQGECYWMKRRFSRSPPASLNVEINCSNVANIEGIQKCIKAQSSERLFWIGVPVISNRLGMTKRCSSTLYKTCKSFEKAIKSSFNSRNCTNYSFSTYSGHMTWVTNYSFFTEKWWSKADAHYRTKNIANYS